MNDPRHMWIPPFRVISEQPGPADFCLVLFAEGRRVSVHNVADYCDSLRRAYQVADKLQCQVKLLPMTAAELNAFLHITSENIVKNTADDPAMRQLVVSACKETVVSSNDQLARANALEILVQTGLGAW